ncbi:hypothetical protein, partial [Aeromonas dhakensis]|uniref:hypothetical protein n=1 Tax=Aeromonas dhakensis TaxID=196024 RepID=UPI003BA2B69D
QQHLAHTTITAHHGHTDRIVHLHPLKSLLRKETVLPACARFEKPAVAVVGNPKNQQHIY